MFLLAASANRRGQPVRLRRSEIVLLAALFAIPVTGILALFMFVSSAR